MSVITGQQSFYPVTWSDFIYLLYISRATLLLKAAAEMFKTKYGAHKVVKFNLPISGKSDLELPQGSTEG